MPPPYTMTSRSIQDPPTIKLKLSNTPQSPNPFSSPTMNAISPIASINNTQPRMAGSPIHSSRHGNSQISRGASHINAYATNQWNDENDFQQMISNQQLQFKSHTMGGVDGPTNKKSKISSSNINDSLHVSSAKKKRHLSRGKHHTRGDRGEENEIQEQPTLDSGEYPAQDRVSKLIDETLTRKNRVLEEMSRRYESQIEQLTFMLEQKDQYFEGQRQKWDKMKSTMKKDFEAREASLLEEIEALRRRKDSNVNVKLTTTTGANQTNNSQMISQLASQKSAERSKFHRKIEKLEAENQQLQTQLQQSQEKLERAENVVKMMEQHKREAEKKSEKIKDKFDRDKEINQLNNLLQTAESEAQNALDQASKLRNENFELKKLNAQLKKMNERYFAVLRALNESEKVILQKETELHQLTEKYQQLARRMKSSRLEYDQGGEGQITNVSLNTTPSSAISNAY